MKVMKRETNLEFENKKRSQTSHGQRSRSQRNGRENQENEEILTGQVDPMTEYTQKEKKYQDYIDSLSNTNQCAQSSRPKPTRASLNLDSLNHFQRRNLHTINLDKESQRSIKNNRSHGLVDAKLSDGKSIAKKHNQDRQMLAQL